MFRILSKKCLIAISIFLVSVSGVTFPANAEESVSVQFAYYVDTDGNAVLTGCESDSGNCPTSEIVIPPAIDGHKVVAINNGFRGLTSVSIPSSVTSIGDWAFYGNALTSVSIPSSVTSIGEGAFQNNQLTSISIPSSVTSIGNRSFSYNSLTSISIPSSVTSIGDWAFFYNRLASISIPSSVTSIGDWAYAGNQLTSVSIPSSVTSIGSFAFSDNLLKSASFSGNAPTAGLNVFANNSDLDYLEVSPTSQGWYATWSRMPVPAFASTPAPLLFTYDLDSLGNAAITGSTGYWPTPNLVIPSEIDGHPVISINGGFDGNALTSVTIPSSVTSIANMAFAYNSLTSISIPSSVTSIGDLAFAYNSLTSISIPSSVTSIGDLAFYANTLTSVSIPSSVTSIGNRAFSYNSLTSISIPSSVTSIGDYTFIGNQLTSASIGSSVTSIGEGAFQNNQLTSISIPSSVTSIGDWAFFSNRLASISLPSSVTSIGHWAFAGNQLTSVSIPSSVTSIGYVAFAWNCLKSVTFLGDAPTDGSDVFEGNSELAYLEVGPTSLGWNGTWSGIPVVIHFDKPSAPQINSVDAIAGHATIRFSEPSYDGGTAITDYLIQYRAANATNWSTFAHAPSATTLSYTITGLTNGVTYEFRVSAINGAGVGQASETSSAEPNKATPSVLVNPTASEIEVGQTLSASSLTAGSVSKAGTWSWLNLSLTPGRGTSSQVAVFTPTDSANYESVQVSIPVKVNLLPLRPAISSVTSDNGSITATIAPARGITARTITSYQYSLDGGQSVFDAELSGRSFTVSDLVNGQQVSVQVRAVNADGTSPWSSAKTAIPATTPDAPQITFVRAGMNSVLVHFVAPNTSGARIRSFQYSLDGGQSWQAPSVPAQLSPIKITGLTRKTDYQIQVRSINIKGAGEGSNVVNVRTANCWMSQCTKFYLPQ